MENLIPESHLDLLVGPICVAIATILPDGQPQAQNIWCTYDGQHILMFTKKGFQKERNMQERPIATVLATDPKNPYRYIEVRGKVDEITQNGAKPLADQLTRLYENRPAYYGYITPKEDEDKEELVICKIKPVRVVTYG